MSRAYQRLVLSVQLLKRRLLRRSTPRPAAGGSYTNLRCRSRRGRLRPCSGTPRQVGNVSTSEVNPNGNKWATLPHMPSLSRRGHPQRVLVHRDKHMPDLSRQAYLALFRSFAVVSIVYLKIGCRDALSRCRDPYLLCTDPYSVYEGR